MSQRTCETVFREIRASQMETGVAAPRREMCPVDATARQVGRLCCDKLSWFQNGEIRPRPTRADGSLILICCRAESHELAVWPSEPGRAIVEIAY